MLSKYTSSDTKLQCFQYKILHRIFPCNHNLAKWKIKGNAECDCCNVTDTIEHFFYYCMQSKAFWQCIENWFGNLSGVFIPLRIVNIIFGIPYNKSQDKLLLCLNFIILHGKWFIFLCKREQKQVFLVSFLKYLKHVLLVEKSIALRRNQEQEFIENWFFIENAI